MRRCGPICYSSMIDTFTQYDVDRAAAWPALKWLLIFGRFPFWFFVEAGLTARATLSQARAMPKLEADIRMAMFDHIQHHSPPLFQ